MSQLLLPSSEDAAVLSPCGTYRYHLTRDLGGRGTVVWVLLNPSTADATVPDPTLRRCIGFTRAWLYGRLEVVNLFAYRATHPKDMIAKARAGFDVVGPENDRYVVEAVQRASCVVLGWGANGAHKLLRPRTAETLALIRAHYAGPLRCLRVTSAGCPEHPLMVPNGTMLVAYEGAA